MAGAAGGPTEEGVLPEDVGRFWGGPAETAQPHLPPVVEAPPAASAPPAPPADVGIAPTAGSGTHLDHATDVGAAQKGGDPFTRSTTVPERHQLPAAPRI